MTITPSSNIGGVNIKKDVTIFFCFYILKLILSINFNHPLRKNIMQNNLPLLSHELRTAEVLIVSNDKTIDGTLLYMTFKAFCGLLCVNGEVDKYNSWDFLIHNTVRWYLKQKHIEIHGIDLLIDNDFSVRSFEQEKELYDFVSSSGVETTKLDYGKLHVVEYCSFIHNQPFNSRS